MKEFFRKKAVNAHAENSALKRNFTATDLTLLGIGGIIDAGILVLTGIASSIAGPLLSFPILLPEKVRPLYPFLRYYVLFLFGDAFTAYHLATVLYMGGNWISSLFCL